MTRPNIYNLTITTPAGRFVAWLTGLTVAQADRFMRKWQGRGHVVSVRGRG